jgi:hypothetical protein
MTSLSRSRRTDVRRDCHRLLPIFAPNSAHSTTHTFIFGKRRVLIRNVYERLLLGLVPVLKLRAQMLVPILLRNTPFEQAIGLRMAVISGMNGRGGHAVPRGSPSECPKH